MLGSFLVWLWALDAERRWWGRGFISGLTIDMAGFLLKGCMYCIWYVEYGVEYFVHGSLDDDERKACKDVYDSVY